MRKVVCAESSGTAGFLSFVVGSGVMGERIAAKHGPVLPPRTRKVRWPLNGLTAETHEQIMAVFRAMRDEVNGRVILVFARPRDERAA